MFYVIRLFSLTIGKIDSITNPQLLYNYDLYMCVIEKYDDRIIIANNTKTEELKILSNGEIEFISFIDISSSRAVLNNNKYILPYYSDPDNMNGFYVYDLTKTPMELITYVNVNSSYNGGIDRNKLFFNDSHIMLYDLTLDRILMICDETYNIDRFIIGAGYGFYESYHGLILHISYTTANNLRLRIFDINENNTLVEISSLDIFGHDANWGQISIVDSKIIMVTIDALLIIDLSDIYNPIIDNKVYHPFASFHFTESHIYGFDRAGNLVVFEKDSLDNYNLIHTQYIDGIYFGTTPYNILYDEPFLYLNADVAFLVFDTKKDYSLINHYGHRVVVPSFSHSENEIYFLKDNFFDKTQSIYNVLDGTKIASLNYDNVIFPAILNTFKILNNRLYILNHDIDGVYFDIYQLDDQETILLNSVLIDGSYNTYRFTIIDDMVFFSTSRPYRVTVYKIFNDELIYYVTFPGRIQHDLGSQPTNFVLNIDVSKKYLYILDINDLSNILFERYISVIDDDPYIYYIDDNHFVLSIPLGGNNSYIYSFDIEYDTLNLLRSFNQKNLFPFGGVITVSDDTAFSARDFSEFFTIQNGQLVSIGSMKYDGRIVSASYTSFFPEKNVMVLAAQGGLWVYDIEYTEYVSDSDLVTPQLKTELLGNYPNPFNPETTIRFNVGNAFIHSEPVHVLIDIYNIRGQKVRSLLDGLFESGSNTVVWDGRDDSGRELGSGVYLYRMMAGEETSVRKMVLLK